MLLATVSSCLMHTAPNPGGVAHTRDSLRVSGCFLYTDRGSGLHAQFLRRFCVAHAATPHCPGSTQSSFPTWLPQCCVCVAFAVFQMMVSGFSLASMGRWNTWPEEATQNRVGCVSPVHPSLTP